MAKLKTGRHTSALKALRQSKRREERNQAVRSKIRTIVKKVEAAVAKKDTGVAQSLLKVAYSEWDKAAKKNVIHMNAASNQKERLARLVNSLSAQAQK